MATTALHHFRRSLVNLWPTFPGLSHCNCQKRIIEGKGLTDYAHYNIIRSLSYLVKKPLQPSSERTCLQKAQERSLATKSTKKQTVKKVIGKKPDVKQGAGVSYHELPIIFVNANYNNTMFTITDHNGLVVAWTSAGVEGYKGAKRGTNYAGQMAATAAAKKAKTLGIDTLRVKIKGMGPGRHSSIKGLVAGGIEVVSITDVTPVPHNGCKPPKQRRI